MNPLTLLHPIFLAGLGLLVPVLLTFLVKRNRQVMRVPSTMVWRLGARTTVKSRRLRDLRRLLALLACLLGVAALVFAAARPSGKRADAIVFVVDVSASMEGAPLSEARRVLSAEVAGLGPSGSVAIVTAGAEPKVVLPPSAPGPLVDQTIASIATVKDIAAIDDAVGLAEGLASASNARVVVLSDQPVDADVSRRSRRAELRTVGRSDSTSDNLGITSLFTRSPPDARDDSEREASITIATSSKIARRGRLSVRLGARLLADRPIEVPAQGERTETVRLHGAGRVVVRIEPSDGKADSLAADDEASLTEFKRRAPRVALIHPHEEEGKTSPAVFFVTRALEAAGVTELEKVESDGAAAKDPEVAVVLADGPARPRTIPSFFIDVEPEEHPLTVQPTARNQTKLRSIATEEPLLKGISLDDVTILRAKAATAMPKDTVTLAELDGGPVLLSGGTGPSSWVWLGIAPEASDLVLRVAFPVLVSNVLAHLGGSIQVVTAKTVPRAEVMLTPTPTSNPLPPAPASRWRIPAGPAALIAAFGAFLLALEAWLTFKKRWAA